MNGVATGADAGIAAPTAVATISTPSAIDTRERFIGHLRSHGAYSETHGEPIPQQGGLPRAERLFSSLIGREVEWHEREDVRLVLPSTRAFYRESRRAQGISLVDFLHGYVYGRWPYFYIGSATGARPIPFFLRPVVAARRVDARPQATR